MEREEHLDEQYLRMVPVSGHRRPQQMVREMSERWACTSVRCPYCGEGFERVNRPVTDLRCTNPQCGELWELKSAEWTVRDKRVWAAGGLEAMLRVLGEGGRNFAFLRYRRRGADEYDVRDLFFIPKWLMTRHIITNERELKNRRGYWMHNITIGHLPESARVPVILAGRSRHFTEVLRQWQDLQRSLLEPGGWTSDVLCCVQSLARSEFTVKDMYAFEGRLQLAHPGSGHVREKIRQQLQVLERMGLVARVARGRYAVRDQTATG